MRYIHVLTFSALVFLSAGCATTSVPEDSASIDNTAWQLVWLRDADVSAPVAERAPSLAFDVTEGRASGATGCNVFGGPYTRSGDELTFGMLVSTKMYCEGVMDQESAYTDALEATRGWQIEDGELVLIDANGEALARFRVQP